MKDLVHPLLRTKYTKVRVEDKIADCAKAPSLYRVEPVEGLAWVVDIPFQKGPILEYGINGVGNEDLLVMVLDRLEHWQKTEFACRENALAITKIEEALMWLRKRTEQRVARGVEGTHEV